MCAQGYCQYGTSNRRCRAEVPDATCSIVPICYSGGLVSSSCVDGHCLCRSNMHIGADGACHSGWWPDGSDQPPSVLAANFTLAQVEALSAADAQEDREIALNVVLGVLSIAAPTSALLASLAAMTQLFRRSAARKGLLVTEEAGPSYEKLLGSPSS